MPPTTTKRPAERGASQDRGVDPGLRGVAPNILSDRLQTLVEHGLLEHRDNEYAPTQKGLDVNPVLVALMQWGDRHVYGEEGAPRVLVHAKCGHDADPSLRCSHCEEEIGARELRVRPGPGADAEQRRDPLLPAR